MSGSNTVMGAGTVSGPAPQPSAVVDNTIETIFRVSTMAVMALQMIPGVPPKIESIITTVIQDMQQAYSAYRANPTADLLTQIQVVVDKGFEEVNAALHPAP